ncbi:LuxR family transcriptional regulator [Paenibacillus andongensis]|uniref:LuxR family transcriptional regulator n=1 Tax=Paenibacillus andongensis TaxID=2975482 RepID=UPI0021BBA949|nr:LuxR family transcriptional regulator [Paenibacillus andongensis]
MDIQLHETWADRKEALEASYFVGRTTELALISKWHNETYKHTPILNVNGPAGSGKTSLVQMALKNAKSEGFLVHSLDCRSIADISELRHSLTQFPLNSQNRHGQAILFFDHFEESGLWENWFRETWLPQIPTSIRVIIASRSRLDGPWRIQAVWKHSVYLLSLPLLSFTNIAEYAKKHHITETYHIEKLWIISKGHPLTLSLSTELVLTSKFDNSVFETETFQAVLSNWLKEVPDEDMRKLLEAACVLRSFDQDKLTALLASEVTSAMFERLLCLTFVIKTDDGWGVHESIRDLIRLALKARSPDRFEAFERKAAIYYKSKLLNPPAGQRAYRVLGDILYHTGNPLIRAHYHCSRTSSHSLVRVTEESVHELQSYLLRRKAHAKNYVISCGENDTGHVFHYQISREESMLGLPEEEELIELLTIGAELLLLMKDDGAIAGFSASVPLTDNARLYLMNNSYSSAYFAKLTESEWYHLQRTGGWFIRIIDIEDPSDESLRHDSFRMKLSYIQPDAMIIASPLPLPFYEDALLNLGFVEVDHIQQLGYGEGRPASFYQLDLRGKQNEDFINKLVTWDAVQQYTELHSMGENLTKQETKIAEMLLKGFSNEEMAAQLFVSVITVKKHLSAIYRKTNVQNRVQFLAKRLRLS